MMNDQFPPHPIEVAAQALYEAYQRHQPGPDWADLHECSQDLWGTLASATVKAFEAAQ